MHRLAPRPARRLVSVLAPFASVESRGRRPRCDSGSLSFKHLSRGKDRPRGRPAPGRGSCSWGPEPRARRSDFNRGLRWRGAGQGGAGHSTREAVSEKQSDDSELVCAATEVFPPQRSPPSLEERESPARRAGSPGCCLLARQQGGMRPHPSSRMPRLPARTVGLRRPSPASWLGMLRLATGGQLTHAPSSCGLEGGPGFRTHTPWPSKGGSSQTLQECWRAMPAGVFRLKGRQ